MHRELLAECFYGHCLILLWKTLLRVYWWREGALSFVIVSLPVGAYYLLVLRLTAQWHCLLLSVTLIHILISGNILSALSHLHHLLVDVVTQLAVIFTVSDRLLELCLNHFLALIRCLRLSHLNFSFFLLLDLL